MLSGENHDIIEYMINTKKIALIALFVAMSLITFLIESQFPPLFVPGAKMGLSNIFSLLTLVLYGPWEALIVVVVRTLLGALFSSPFALLYSFTAGVLSILVSALFYRFLFPKVSLLAISVFGGVLHNCIQLIVYILISRTAEMVGYLPYLALSGVLSGTIIGLTLTLLLKKIPLSLYERVIDQ